MLARLLIQPANVLVLDEPTNDLDLETLELLEAQLVDFEGTLLLVSHDRVFLDNAVTSTLVFEGDGRVQEYVGGYTDWQQQRALANPEPVVQPRRSASGPAEEPPMQVPREARKKLSYIEQREFDRLPGQIEALEAELRQLNATVAGPDFYRETPEAIRQTLARVEDLQHELLEAYALWDDLDSRKQSG